MKMFNRSKIVGEYWETTSNEEDWLTKNDIYFLWKIYCNSINIPLIMTKNEFESLIDYERVKHRVSPYLAPSRAFKIFLDNSFVPKVPYSAHFMSSPPARAIM